MSHQDPAAGGRPPTEEEMRAMEEQMRRIRVQDVLFNAVANLLSVGGRRLGLTPDTQGERDLEEVRIAIEGVRALMPLLGEEEGRAVKQPLSQLQMAYAREAQQPAGTGGAGEGAGAPGEGRSPEGDQAARPGQEGEAPRRSPQEEAERAKARSKIWTPGGS